MDSIISVLQNGWRYLTLIRITDLLDIAIMSFAIYKLLSLVRSTRAESILKGIVIFILALWLSSLLNLRGINYIMSYVVEWGCSGAVHRISAGAAPRAGAAGQQEHPASADIGAPAAVFGAGKSH